MSERGVIKNFRFVYNPKQALFYIDNGVELIDTGIYKGDVYFKFKDSEYLQKIFQVWVLRKQSNK